MWVLSKMRPQFANTFAIMIARRDVLMMSCATHVGRSDSRLSYGIVRVCLFFQPGCSKGLVYNPSLVTLDQFEEFAQAS